MMINDRIFRGFKRAILEKSIVIILVSLITSSCSDKYLLLSKNYHYNGQSEKPDYSDLNNWAAHPRKQDPSDSIPLPLKDEARDSLVDVFFLHPTMFTSKNNNGKMTADIGDSYLNAKTDYSTILYQASVFNQHARIFAPRFREAHISTYFINDTLKAKKAFDIAYEDVKTAFEYYLEHFNQGRPIIIASHSQGTTHALRLLKNYFDDKPLERQLVVAYLIGMYLPKESFSSLKMCDDSLQTGCLCGWRTFRKGYRTSYVLKESFTSYVTNPITWKRDEEYAARRMNKGSVLKAFNKIYKNVADAQINKDVLWIRKPKFPWSFLLFTKNYHVGDINLFYLNIRENVEQRTRSYLKQHP